VMLTRARTVPFTAMHHVSAVQVRELERRKLIRNTRTLVESLYYDDRPCTISVNHLLRMYVYMYPYVVLADQQFKESTDALSVTFHIAYVSIKISDTYSLFMVTGNRNFSCGLNIWK
jgi:hypothetical protein